MFIIKPQMKSVNQLYTHVTLSFTNLCQIKNLCRCTPEFKFFISYECIYTTQFTTLLMMLMMIIIMMINEDDR